MAVDPVSVGTPPPLPNVEGNFNSAIDKAKEGDMASQVVLMAVMPQMMDMFTDMNEVGEDN